MDRIAVQIGAGNIGRGFIAQLFHESGFQVRFVDANRELVDRLNVAGQYTIDIAANPSPPPIRISNFHAYHASDSSAVAEALTRAEIAAISAGAAAQQPIARMMAEALVDRLRADRPPLNVLVCENPPGEANAFRDVVRDELDAELRSLFEDRIGFVDTVIGRMVPVMEEDDSLHVRVEPYCELPIDADAVCGQLPDIAHLHAESPFAFWIERKLYMHNAAHAAAAYLGYLHGCNYIHEAMNCPEVIRVVDGVLRETASALSDKYKQDTTELQAHADDLLRRFANAALRDTVARVARDPLRKLSQGERFMRAADCCLAHRVEPISLAFAAAAAIRYDHPSDSAANRLQSMVRGEGWDAVLRKVCGIEPESVFAQLVKQSGLAPAPGNASTS